MADADSMRRYTAQPYPNIEGGQGKFVTEQLRELQKTLATYADVIKKLEARLVAGGL